MDARPALGRRGEDLAADLYLRQGFVVAARNFRCREGEIDVIASRPGLTVFCEVKVRSNDYFGFPAEGVRPRQRLRVRAAACRWLAANARRGAVRFDVVSVIVRPGGLEVEHIPNAF